jgi:4-amino-4-deoxy-L-arabinose transferase-like glycosyltransferase
MKWWLYLIAVIIAAAFLRFYSIGVNPPSLTWDEVAWGYNAYSLGIDGKDEFGVFLPYKYLESFGDFKPPMYAYLDIIPVKVFGLNEFATRVPSALFGTLSVLLTYFLVIQIFYKSKSRENYALFSTLLLGVSPWHINLSRAAFEANVASFFLILALTCFLYAVNKKPWFLVIAAISFVASMYTFNTSRVVAPILVLLLTILFFKALWRNKKQTLVSLVVGILLIAPIVPFLLSPQANLRFREVNIFSDPKEVLTANQEIKNDNNAKWSKAIHNRRLLYAVSFVSHYFDNLNPNFLFITGDGNPKFSTQDVGQMYIWSLPFFIAGLLLLFRKREGYWYIVPLLILIGIIPAATARETPHALRIETTLPAFQILVAYGFISFVEWSRKPKHMTRGMRFASKSFVPIVLLLLIANVFYYLYGYYVHYAREFSGEWQYGYKQSIAYVKEHQNEFDTIEITSALGRPYIYYLFYLHMSPQQFRDEAVVKRDAFGFVKVESIGKLKFEDSVNPQKTPDKKVLYITDKYNVREDAKVLKTVKLLNGESVLFLYTL